MSTYLNLKLKDGIDPSVLFEYGFKAKYSEDTGKIIKYIKKIHIEGEEPEEKHFTFELYTESWSWGWIFRKQFSYSAWMSAFRWNNVCEKEALRLLYDLIINGIVEPYEEDEVKKGAN